MSGATPDRDPAAGASPDSPGAAVATKPAWWKKIAAAYQRRPLLYGFFTLLGVTVLMAVLSPLMSSRESQVRSTFGREETPASRLRSIAGNLRRMDEFALVGQFGRTPNAELLRDTLNPWMLQLRPGGAWYPDPALVPILTPQVEAAVREQQRLRKLIVEQEKKLSGKSAASGQGAGKERAAVDELRKRLQSVDAAVAQLRAFHQGILRDLSNLTFSLEDAFVIQGAVWMRDISNRLRDDLTKRSKGAVDHLALAQALFDWTIRNVALDERERQTTELVWESLLWGRAPSHTRAWIFMELCRQQGLETVMLGYRSSADATDTVWVPAVLLTLKGSPPDLYLFDHKWGLPLPGPAGEGVATLTQAIQAPETLAQLSGLRSYPVSSAELRDVVALLDVSPHLLARRMQLLEGELQGADRLVLTSDLSKLVSRLQKLKGLARIEAWSWPGQCLMNSRQVAPAALGVRFLPFSLPGVEERGQRNQKLIEEHLPRFQELAILEKQAEAAGGTSTAKPEQRRRAVPGFLWRGRMLQFRGVFADVSEDPQSFKQGAPNVFQSGRFLDQELDQMTNELLAEALRTREGRAKAEREGASSQTLQAWDQRAVMIQAQLLQMPGVRLDRQFVRSLATYWIAQMAHERGDYSDAAEYFRHVRDVEAPALRRVIDTLPEKPRNDYEQGVRQYVEYVVKPTLDIWKTGANYNLARALEASGRHAEAIDAYRADNSADQRPGSLYRARRLEEQLARQAKPTEAKKQAEEKKREEKKPAEAKKPADAKQPANGKGGADTNPLSPKSGKAGKG